MNKEEFKADHFKNIRELLETCKMWIRDEDYDALGRWFDLGALEELINLIKKQQKEIEELKNDKSFLLDDLEDCISKDKIKEKIKELEYKEFLYKEEKRFTEEEIKFNYAKRILQELLGEEKDE